MTPQAPTVGLDTSDQAVGLEAERPNHLTVLSTATSQLLERGDRVIAIDNLTTGSHDNIEHLLDRADFEFVLGSILTSRPASSGLVALWAIARHARCKPASR